MNTKSLKMKDLIIEQSFNEINKIMTAFRSASYGRNISENFKSMWVEDAKDLLVIYRRITSRRFKDAKEKMENLDTAVREKIPIRIWEFLEYY